MKITINQLKRIIKKEVKRAKKNSYAVGDYVIVHLSGAVYAENPEADVPGVVQNVSGMTAEVLVALGEGDDEDVPEGGTLSDVTVDFSPGGSEDGYIVRKAKPAEKARFLSIQEQEEGSSDDVPLADWPGFVPVGSGFEDPSELAEYDRDTGGWLSKAAKKLGKKSIDELMVCDTENDETSEFYDETIDAIKNEKELSGWGTWAATGEFYGRKVVIINDAGMGMILM